MKKFLILFLFFFNYLDAQKIERVEPPNWWVGMQMSKIQIMLYGDNLAALDPKIDSEEVKLIAVDRVDNENYIFLTLQISKNAMPQNIDINFYCPKSEDKNKVKLCIEVVDTGIGIPKEKEK